MIVSLAKHGGAIAGMRIAPTVIDSNNLPKREAEELVRLVGAAMAVAATKEGGPGRGRDALNYTITVENDDKPAVFYASDTDLPPAVADLVGWIDKKSHAR
jgi:hypothetical protein